MILLIESETNYNESFDVIWPDDKQGIGYLTGLPGAKERLQIFNADLDRPDSFNEAIEGCTGVFHAAHPTGFTKEEAEEMVIKRATEGTIGVLQACLNSKTVKRVVYTSGISTVLFSGNGQQVADESAWTDIDYFRSLNVIGNPSLIAKTYTERAALEFAEQHGLDLVTLIPSLVFGPFICPKIPRSVHMGLAMVLGMFSVSFAMTLANWFILTFGLKTIQNLFSCKMNSKLN
jgi:nucleoside-diphosphate-sugar epimerase